MNRQLTFFALLLMTLFFVSSCENQQAFRFAWLTDIHVAAGSSGEDDLKAAVSDINALGNIDFVLATGDISEINIGDNLQKAKAALDGLNMPYYIIPGNHDTKWTDSGNGNFLSLWGDDKFTFEYDGIKFIGMHEGPELRMADGHFAPNDLRWLDSLLSNLPDKKQSLVFVTHYPIDSSIDNYDVFLDLIKGYNFRMILHGHGHRNRLSSYDGIPGVMSRSLLRGRKETGGYTIASVKHDSIYFSERTTGVETGEPWARLPLLKPFYQVQTDSIVRPDFSINDSFPNVRSQWVFDSHTLMTASPVIAGDVVFAGDAAGTMYALSMRDGKELWRYRTGKKVCGTAAVSSSRLVFSCADSNVYCLDAHNGAVLWTYKTAAPNVAVPVIEDAIVYIGGSDGIFRSIDLNSGRLLWKFEGVKGYVETKPVIYKNNIIFTAWDQTVYALDKRNGSLVWTWAEGRPGLLYSPAACWPVVSDGKVFIVAPDRYMTAINAETGKTVWRSNRYEVRETLGVSESGKLVYGECMHDTVFAVNARRRKFSPAWAKSFHYGYDIAPSMLQSKDGTVFFATKNGLIVAFDESGGGLKWKHKYGNTLINTVTPVDANRVVFSNMDGRVVLLNAL